MQSEGTARLLKRFRNHIKVSRLLHLTLASIVMCSLAHMVPDRLCAAPLRSRTAEITETIVCARQTPLVPRRCPYVGVLRACRVGQGR